jgi:hypothetical protein
MLFLPAFLGLLVSSFLFGEVSGEQICARGYIEGVLSASLLGVGALGVFSGIAWMLEAYGESSRSLRRTCMTFIFLTYFIIVALLGVSGIDILDNAFHNDPPTYALVLMIAYGPGMLGLVGCVRKWLMPKEAKRSSAQLAAVYAPAAYVVLTSVIYSILTSYQPRYWGSFDDWKVFLALSVAMFFPACIMIIYARALPDMRRTSRSPYPGSRNSKSKNSSAASPWSGLLN